MPSKEKKKRLSSELQKNIDETIDGLDDFTRKTAERFSQLFVKASMEKMDKILNTGKTILKEKVRKGFKYGKTQSRKNRKPTNG
jgi:hypothetical protein